MFRIINSCFRPSRHLSLPALVLAVTACAPSLEQAGTEAAISEDLCAVYGRYGDGICDADCPQEDPDCESSEESGTTSSTSSSESAASNNTEDTETETRATVTGNVRESGSETESPTNTESSFPEETSSSSVGETDSPVELTSSETEEEAATTTSEEAESVWAYSAPGHTHHAPAVDAVGNAYFAVHTDDNLLRLSKISPTGSVLWSMEDESLFWHYHAYHSGKSAATLSYDEQTVYVLVDTWVPYAGAYLPSLIAISAASGEEQWRTGPTDHAGLQSRPAYCSNIATRPGIIALTCWDWNDQFNWPTLLVFDADGQQQWLLYDVNQAAPTFDRNGNIVVVGSENNVLAYSINGELLGEGPVPFDEGYDLEFKGRLLVDSNGEITTLFNYLVEDEYGYIDIFSRALRYSTTTDTSGLIQLSEEMDINLAPSGWTDNVDDIFQHPDGGFVVWVNLHWGAADVYRLDNNFEIVWGWEAVGDLKPLAIDADGSIHIHDDEDTFGQSSLVALDENGELISFTLLDDDGNFDDGENLGLALLDDGTVLVNTTLGFETDSSSLSSESWYPSNWVAYTGESTFADDIWSREGGTRRNDRNPLAYLNIDKPAIFDVDNGIANDADDDDDDNMTDDSDDSEGADDVAEDISDDDGPDDDIDDTDSSDDSWQEASGDLCAVLGCWYFDDASCQCDEQCEQWGDCCVDYYQACWD